MTLIITMLRSATPLDCLVGGKSWSTFLPFLRQVDAQIAFNLYGALLSINKYESIP